MEIEKGDESSITDAPIFVTPKHPDDPSSLSSGEEDGEDSKASSERKKQGEDIKTLFNRRNELERQLQECEDEIYNMETNYFERSISNGNCNVIAGWYGFITPPVGATSVKHGSSGLTGSTGFGSPLSGPGGRDASQGIQSQTRKSGSGAAGGSGSAASANGAYKLRDSDRIFSLSSVTSRASKQTFQNSSFGTVDNKKTTKYK